MADTTITSTTTTNLHEDEEKKLYEDDDEDDDEQIFELFKLEMDKLKEKGSYDINDETSFLNSLFKCNTRLNAVVTSAYAHAVEGSERSDKLRAIWAKLNENLYWSAATSTGAGCFIEKRSMKLLLINEEEEEEEEEDCCAICLMGIKCGDVVGWIEYCEHSFHFVCLNQWMKRKHTCPICRLEMDG